MSEIGKWSTTQIEREKSKAERVYGQLEKQYPNLVPYSEHQSSPPHHMEMELGGILEPAERKIAEKMCAYRQIVKFLKIELVERGGEDVAGTSALQPSAEFKPSRDSQSRAVRESVGISVGGAEDTAPTTVPELTLFERRALTVAEVIEELNILKPQMYRASDYKRLNKEHPEFLTFQETEKRSDLKELLENIQLSKRHFRLAQQIAASQYGVELDTIKKDWKKYKPSKYRRKPAK